MARVFSDVGIRWAEDCGVTAVLVVRMALLSVI